MKLSLSNIKKVYKTKHEEKKIFDFDNVMFYGDKLIGITGQSGAGKTTLLNLLGLLDLDFSGDYYIDEINISNLSKAKVEEIRIKTFGFVFQEYNLINYLSVYENVVLALKYQHKEINDDHIDEILRELHIYELKNKLVNNISGGEAQRVAIARAILMDSKVILADEPTGALDYVNGMNIMEILKNLSLKYHKLIIVVTHNLGLLKYFDETYEVRDYGIYPKNWFKIFK